MGNEKRFAIFRAAAAPLLKEAGCMSIAPPTPEQAEGVKKLMAAGYAEGAQDKILVNIPGFSLVHVWLKKDYPLLLHSHNVDCLYYVVAGSLQMGTEALGPRDSVFVPAGTPYTYRPGPEGVELLEFRQEGSFDLKIHTKGAAFFQRALETVIANSDSWRDAKLPALNV